MVLIFPLPVFSCLYNSIPSSPAYCVFASQLIGYESACSTYKQFLKQGKLLTKKLMEEKCQELQLKKSLRKFYGRNYLISNITQNM